MPSGQCDKLRVDIWFGCFRAVLRRLLYVCLAGWIEHIEGDGFLVSSFLPLTSGVFRFRKRKTLSFRRIACV